MEVLVISNFCFKSNYSRPYLSYKYFKRSYDTKIIYSNFHHQEKAYKEYDDDDMIAIDTLKYKKNISLNRIISHLKFSLDAVSTLKQYEPKIVYVNVPPNILGYLVVKYCKKNNIDVIVDVVDIWPEAFPVEGILGKIFNKTIGEVWKKMRAYAIKNSTICIAESEYFIEKFLYRYDVIPVNLAKISEETLIDYKYYDSNVLIIGYVGSISNIYDFESLIKILKLIKERKEVLIKIIGDGEKREWLIKELEKNNIKYKYYGKIFDENEKIEILKDCMFGYNGYKESTEVALSYKSLDYLSYGIPLINSTKGDTSYIVKKYNIGVNFNGNDIESLVSEILILEEKEFYEMKKRALKVFKELFSWESFKKDMDNAFQNILLK